MILKDFNGKIFDVVEFAPAKYRTSINLKDKNVYGYQILVSLLSCGGLVLTYSNY